jgi:hypothetical protein
LLKVVLNTIKQTYWLWDHKKVTVHSILMLNDKLNNCKF